MEDKVVCQAATCLPLKRPLGDLRRLEDRLWQCLQNKAWDGYNGMSCAHDSIL